MTMNAEMQAHLATGVTTLCRVWAVERSDGHALGFTDHDRDLAFDGITFRADTGLTAMALQQGTGLSVDNTEAMGALSDAAISEADIEAGLYDGAEVRCWLVNWADVNLRALQFRGQIGEIRRDGGAFEAELLGLTDLLNQPMGRGYQAPCAAVLGDASCGKDISEEGYQAEVEVLSVEGNILTFASMPGYEVQWFQRGVLEVLSGSGAGQSVPIKRDWETQNGREITLWTAMGAPVSAGDTVRLTAGCDKRMETCRNKFNNLINFQGFPDIPGNDWTVAFPASETATGGSRR
jgi:uncharacterized phage protein (TIGR02218 family)